MTTETRSCCAVTRSSHPCCDTLFSSLRLLPLFPSFPPSPPIAHCTPSTPPPSPAGILEPDTAPTPPTLPLQSEPLHPQCIPSDTFCFAPSPTIALAAVSFHQEPFRHQSSLDHSSNSTDSSLQGSATGLVSSSFRLTGSSSSYYHLPPCCKFKLESSSSTAAPPCTLDCTWRTSEDRPFIGLSSVTLSHCAGSLPRHLVSPRASPQALSLLADYPAPF